MFLAVWYITVPPAGPPPTPVPKKDAKGVKEATAQRSQGTPVDIIKLVTLFAALTIPLISYQFPITLRKPLAQPHNHPTQPICILSSVRSNTGVIVVGEVLNRPANLPPLDPTDPHAIIQESRYLRADHSILGGVWIGSKATHSLDRKSPVATDAAGTRLGDSIYTTFVLQEATRFVRGTNPKTALTM